ncbi:MAG TPA: DUF2934 domain-containing protein [Bryobacteraceae bacterium]|nr:DUF2934 domain-containing protein [Bryobacteraceae bacterium]
MAKTASRPARVCDKFVTERISPAKQRKIAVLAYQLWVTRGFQDGSPQEDWLRAQRVIAGKG